MAHRFFRERLAGLDERPRRGRPRLLVYAECGLVEQAGVPIDPETGIAWRNPGTLDTTVPNRFLAGVDVNGAFIEHGPSHGDPIVAGLRGDAKPLQPTLSAAWDTWLADPTSSAGAR